MHDVRNGNSFVTSVGNSAVRSNQYTLVFKDGEQSDLVESAMAQVEGATAGSLKRAAAAAWPLDPSDIELLAALTALQIGRTPALHDAMKSGIEQLFEKTDFMTAEMTQLKSEDPVAQQERLEDMARLSALADGPSVPVSDLRDTMDTFPLVAYETSATLVEPILGMNWTFLQASDAEFFTSDQPVVLWPAPSTPPMMGTGLLTAERVTYPLSPQVCLMLEHSTEPYGRHEPMCADVDQEGVREVNAMTATFADRHLITTVGASIELTPRREPVD